MTNEKKSYSNLTPLEWYQSTGEYVTPNTTLVYESPDGELIINILDDR